MLTPTAGLPATRNSFPVVFATSGPATGCGSGTLPGHIGTCVCPGDGCHTGFCALRPPNADTTQRAKIKSFMTIPKGRIGCGGLRDPLSQKAGFQGATPGFANCSHPAVCKTVADPGANFMHQGHAERPVFPTLQERGWTVLLDPIWPSRFGVCSGDLDRRGSRQR